MKKMKYIDGNITLDATKLWIMSIFLSRVGQHWHEFGRKADRLFIDYLVSKGAAIHIKNHCYKYDKEKLSEFIGELSTFIGFDKKKSDDIVSVDYKPNGTTFHTADGGQFELREGICLGVFSISVTKQIPFYKNLHSTVTFLKSDINHLLENCDKSKSNANKLKLATEALRLYKLYYGNSCLGHYPQGSAKTYRDAIKNAEKNGAHWLDGINGFHVGKTFISTDDIKSKLEK